MFLLLNTQDYFGFCHSQHAKFTFEQILDVLAHTYNNLNESDSKSDSNMLVLGENCTCT